MPFKLSICLMFAFSIFNLSCGGGGGSAFPNEQVTRKKKDDTGAGKEDIKNCPTDYAPFQPLPNADEMTLADLPQGNYKYDGAEYYIIVSDEKKSVYKAHFKEVKKQENLETNTACTSAFPKNEKSQFEAVIVTQIKKKDKKLQFTARKYGVGWNGKKFALNFQDAPGDAGTDPVTFMNFRWNQYKIYKLNPTELVLRAYRFTQIQKSTEEFLAIKFKFDKE